MSERIYQPQRMGDANRIAAAISSLPAESQDLIIKMVDSMLIGATIAEQQLTAQAVQNSA